MSRRLAPLVLLALLGACAAASREPVAEARIESAAPYGIPGLLRSWGDSVGEADVAALRADLLGRAQVMHAEALERGEPLSEVALALSGGGAAGAFGAGVLAGWSERGDRPEFDVVTGVSTGAIIALFAFLGPSYDDQLEAFYTQYSTDDLLAPAPFSVFTGGAALSDTSSYAALVDFYLDEAILEALAREADRGRVLLIGTTNLDASRPVMWNLTNIARSGHPQALTLIRDVVRASSAIPAVFPPVVIPVETAEGRTYDEVHVDGGATQQVMLFSPELPVAEIDRAFGHPVDRTLYVIINNSLEKPYEPVDLGVLDIAGKAVSSLIGGSGAGDLYKIYAIAERDAVEFNVLWIPKTFDVVATEPFDPAYMRALHALGREVGAEGAAWLDRPPNFKPSDAFCAPRRRPACVDRLVSARRPRRLAGRGKENVMTTSEPLWRWSAADIAQSARSGRITALEATEAAIARMEAVNPALNAVVESLADEARSEAAALDAQDAPKGPLHGVPVTIKINVDQTGRATSNGVPALKDVIAPDDAPLVRNLKAAGAVVIGRTNTPEFSFRADTDNPLYGRTYNPWGRHLSAGGSSGGAGSAVMAGIGALAHGNDIGGSLRFPASANGAVTVKPGLGRVPAWNPSQQAERGLLAQCMSVQGLIARNAADLDLSMPVMIAPDPRDPFHAPLPWRGEPLAGPLRVAVARDDFGFGMHPDVATALDAAATALSNAGYVLEEVEPPLAREAGEVGYRTLMGEVKALMGRDIRNLGSDTLNAIFEEYFRQFPPYEGEELLRMMAQRTHYARQWSVFLETYPLVLTPFLLQPFFGAGRDAEGAEGVRDALGGSFWSFIMNFTGLPAGNLPTHVADLPDGPQPIGVQIVGRRWREDLIVSAMQAIEAEIPPVCETLWRRMG